MDIYDWINKPWLKGTIKKTSDFQDLGNPDN